MSKDDTKDTRQPVQVLTSDQLADVMAQLGNTIVSGITANDRKKVTIGEYDPKSPFHPNKRTAKKLTRKCFQNGTPMRQTLLHDAEIDYLNKLNRSGRYVNRLVEVIIREEGPEKSDHTVELRYKNKTIDDRLANAQHWVNLKDMLSKIYAEQEVLNEQDGIVKKERQSFSSKATQEARARAAAEAQDLEP